jgi:hypothetical protein
MHLCVGPIRVLRWGDSVEPSEAESPPRGSGAEGGKACLRSDPIPGAKASAGRIQRLEPCLSDCSDCRRLLLDSRGSIGRPFQAGQAILGVVGFPISVS